MRSMWSLVAQQKKCATLRMQSLCQIAALAGGRMRVSLCPCAWIGGFLLYEPQQCAIIDPVETRTMASGPPLSPAPLLPSRSRRIHPLRWPLIVITFPFSVLGFLIQIVLGWLGTARLVTRRRLVRLALAIMVIWLLVGQLTMMFDSYSATVSGWPSTARHSLFSERDDQGRRVARLEPARECSLAVRDGMGGGGTGRSDVATSS